MSGEGHNSHGRCPACPLDAGVSCPAPTTAPHLCRHAGAAPEATKRALLRRLGLETGRPPNPASRPVAAPKDDPRQSVAALSLNRQAEAYWRIRACDYRVPIKMAAPDGYDPMAGGCGCLAVCLAGFGRKSDGAVSRECWQCPMIGANP